MPSSHNTRRMTKIVQSMLYTSSRSVSLGNNSQFDAETTHQGCLAPNFLNRKYKEVSACVTNPFSFQLPAQNMHPSSTGSESDVAVIAAPPLLYEGTTALNQRGCLSSRRGVIAAGVLPA